MEIKYFEPGFKPSTKKKATFAKVIPDGLPPFFMFFPKPKKVKKKNG